MGCKRFVGEFFELRGEIDTESVLTNGIYIRADQHANGTRHGEKRARHARMNRRDTSKMQLKKPNPEFEPSIAMRF